MMESYFLQENLERVRKRETQKKGSHTFFSLKKKFNYKKNFIIFSDKKDTKGLDMIKEVADLDNEKKKSTSVSQV